MSLISNHKSTLILILLLSSFLSIKASVNSGEAIPITLQIAIDHALQHNFNLQNARADASIAGKRVWETTADGLPQVSGSLSYQYFIDLPTSLIPGNLFPMPGADPEGFIEVKFGTEHNVSAALSVSQLIFDGGYIVGLQTARIYRELARQNYQRSETEVKKLVTESYYLALATSQNLVIVEQNLKNIEKTLFETQALFEQGFTDALNVDQLKLTVANLKNTISNLQRQKSISVGLLKFQMGMNVNQPVELTDNLEQMLSTLSIESLIAPEFNPKNHIDFQVFYSQERMQLMALRRQMSFYLPTISAFYNYQQNAQRREFNIFDRSLPWYPTSIVGLSVTVPIFSSGLRHSRVQQARLELEKARNNTRMIEQSLQMQKNEADSQLQTAFEKFSNEKENKKLAERIFNQTTIMHKEGLASSLELTQASTQMLNSQANYISAVFELLNAKTKLEQALGKL